LIHYYHFLFILIMLPAHRYILFPYTTLFRSIIGFAQSSYAQLSATSAAVTVNINLTDALSITLGASPTVDFDYNLATDYTQAKTVEKAGHFTVVSNREYDLSVKAEAPCSTGGPSLGIVSVEVNPTHAPQNGGTVNQNVPLSETASPLLTGANPSLGAVYQVDYTIDDATEL